MLMQHHKSEGWKTPFKNKKPEGIHKKMPGSQTGGTFDGILLGVQEIILSHFHCIRFYSVDPRWQ